MQNKMSDLKREYDQLSIPKELDEMINQTITESNEKKSKNKFAILAASAAVFACLVLPINLIPSFADTLADIPVIGSVAKIFTVETYTKKEENIVKDVKLPALSDMSDEAYQEKINGIIQEKVQKLLDEATERAQEYKTAYLETGGTEEGYAEKNMEVVVDYEVFSKTPETLSFLVFGHETLAAAYAEYDYYNIDLKSQKNLSLKDLLGDDFQAIVTSSVLETIKDQVESGDISFFDDVFEDDFIVREDIDFYINGDNALVVVFDKYEIAAGAMGRLAYTIKQ